MVRFRDTDSVARTKELTPDGIQEVPWIYFQPIKSISKSISLLWR